MAERNKNKNHHEGRGGRLESDAGGKAMTWVGGGQGSLLSSILIGEGHGEAGSQIQVTDDTGTLLEAGLPPVLRSGQT